MPIDNPQTLRTLYGDVSPRAAKKVLPRLDRHCRAFIGISPFLVLSSQSADGRADVSPKGDAPGFVAVLDDETILIPDRIGNNRLDTMHNVLENPAVGLLFLVPGMNETLRINGTAELTTDTALLEPLAVRGKVPKVGMLIHVREAFLHCAKALIRSNLWDPSLQIERKAFPSMGQMLADQIGGFTAEEADQVTEHKNKHELY
jgi:hypothetical protein